MPRDRSESPSSRRALIALVASVAVLLVVVTAWLVWPSDTTVRLADGPTSIPQSTTSARSTADGTAVEPSTTAPPASQETTTTTAAAPTTLAPPRPQPPQSPRVTRPAPTRAPAGTPQQPVRLQIGAIGVDASVVDVGLQADEQMEVPPASKVGWYRLGPLPGQGGSAVLAGHIDYNGQRGVFHGLPRVQVGDTVDVTGADGRNQRFVVSVREQVAKASVDLSRYFTHDGSPRLTLITCGGAFNPSVRHYQDNIIITAIPA